tara:strand:- start:13001 stop:13735 length:735 start_codon:yes stop_codon:yes gene_type:complete
MKGVILAGGTGSRLFPLTKVTNKHLLPIYNKPMIFYPIESLKKAGLEEILIVSGRHHTGHFLELLGSGKEMGLKFSYDIQEKEGGIAEALSLAKDFSKEDKIAVYLGDNIFEDDLTKYVENFKKQEKGARIFLKEVDLKNAKRFGIAEVLGNKIVHVEEKPKIPRTNLAITGLYMFDSDVFDIIKTLKPSNRGELEISDVIDGYLKKSSLCYDKIKGFWSDAGTFESLFKSTEFIRKKVYENPN